jgi:hypothetical protein
MSKTICVGKDKNLPRRIGMLRGWVLFWICSGGLFGAFSLSAFAADTSAPVHGLWVWGTLYVLDAPRGAQRLRDFCQSEGINEVYLSISGRSGPSTVFGGESEEGQFASLIALLHQSGIRVEALFGSADADQAGKPREKLLDHVRGIVQFNQKRPQDPFDGIHLDVEPQQRRENYGPDNRNFLPALVDTYRAVRILAEPAGMTVNADIPTKVLKGDLGERKMLLSSLPRFTLMLYEVSSPDDGETLEKKAGKLRKTSQEFFDITYQGLGDPALAPKLAKMDIALRTADYGELLPRMLEILDDAHRANPHYLGWARHSYNDSLKASRN